MKQLVLLLLAIGTLLAQPAVAQSPGGGERVRVAGMLEKLEGDWLAVDVTGGRTQAVMLSPAAKIYGVEDIAAQHELFEALEPFCPPSRPRLVLIHRHTQRANPAVPGGQLPQRTGARA